MSHHWSSLHLDSAYVSLTTSDRCIAFAQGRDVEFKIKRTAKNHHNILHLLALNGSRGRIKSEEIIADRLHFIERDAHKP